MKTLKKFLLSLLSTTALASGFFGGSGGSAPSIGGGITGGTRYSVLFVDPASTIAQDPTKFGYNTATTMFCLGCDVSTATDTFHLVGTARFASLSTGLGHLSSTGVLTSSTLVNADVSSSAAITRSKLANGTANRLVVNDASGIISEVASSGTTTTLLHGDASGIPTFSKVQLTNDVTGNLQVANLNGGGSASSTTFWRGDGTWSSAITSVAATVPGILTISGSPITTSGTLAIGATGTSGGIPYFSSSTTLATSGLLTQSAIVLGGGAAATPTVLGSLGTTSTVLHGNAGGAPTFGSIVNADITNSTIDLTAKVTGALPLVNGGTGTAAASANAAFNALSPLTTKGDVLGYSTVNARLAVGSNGQVLSADSTQTTGLKWLTIAAGTAPTVQKFTTSSGTYTTPTSPAPLYIEVELVGAGGGGSGNAGVGNNGGNTTFGSSLLVGNGGVGGTATAPSQGGAGGTASLGSGPVGTVISGASGGGGTNTPGSAGGNGGASQFGGAGGGGAGNTGGGGIGLNAAANTGSGGGGGGSGAGGSNGGGGSGGYVRAFIYTPSATYSYAVGAKGTGSGSGGGGNAGGDGADGYIIVREYYQ